MKNDLINILVVDDLEYITELISRILTDTGYNVLTASNGAEAIEKFQKYSPDLITIDQRLPDMTGLQLAKKIRNEKNGDNVKLIFITAIDEKEEIKSILNLGSDNFLLKPFRREKLIKTVEAVLSREL